MFKFKRFFSIVVLSLFCLSVANAAPPTDFRQAKKLAKQYVYFDQAKGGALGTAYCGCDWRWVGESGGRTDLDSCGYKIRSPQSKQMVARAERTEWEHVVAMASQGRQRQCWQNGGRTNCRATDPVFNAMEANMHGLTIIVGEVNADRSNFPLGMVSSSKNGMYGQCESKTDFKRRVFEPRDYAKGMTARIHMYVHDFYDLPMSLKQQKLFMAWHKQFPPSDWELERNRRIAKIMGHNNEFVTGERTWTLGHENTGDGIAESDKITLAKGAGAMSQKNIAKKAANDPEFIHGNRNSKIYHLPNCPSYSAMSPKNIVEFKTEGDAKGAGFRKARNCP